MPRYSVLRLADPRVALLDSLDQGLRVELSSIRRQFEGRRELRLVLHVLKAGDDSGGGFDPQRKSALAIDPARKDLSRSGYGAKDNGIAAIDDFLTGSLAAQVTLPRDPGNISHGLPLPARIDRIDRHKQARERARLAGLHIDPPATAHEKGCLLGPIHQEEAVGKFRRLDPCLAFEDEKPARRHPPAFSLDDNVRGELLRSRVNIAAQNQACERNRGRQQRLSNPL